MARDRDFGAAAASGRRARPGDRRARRGAAAGAARGARRLAARAGGPDGLAGRPCRAGSGARGGRRPGSRGGGAQRVAGVRSRPGWRSGGGTEAACGCPCACRCCGAGAGRWRCRRARRWGGRLPRGGGASDEARATAAANAARRASSCWACCPRCWRWRWSLLQLLAVGYASVLAGNAAEAGALALAAGGDPVAGAREALPGWSRARRRGVGERRADRGAPAAARAARRARAAGSRCDASAEVGLMSGRRGAGGVARARWRRRLACGELRWSSRRRRLEPGAGRAGVRRRGRWWPCSGSGGAAARARWPGRSAAELASRDADGAAAVACTAAPVGVPLASRPAVALARLLADVPGATTRAVGRLCLVGGAEPLALSDTARHHAPLVLDAGSAAVGGAPAAVADRIVLVAAPRIEPALAAVVERRHRQDRLAAAWSW